MCSLLSHVKTNILFLPGVYSIFWSHLSVTELLFFLDLFTFYSVLKTTDYLGISFSIYLEYQSPGIF